MSYFRRHTRVTNIIFMYWEFFKCYISIYVQIAVCPPNGKSKNPVKRVLWYWCERQLSRNRYKNLPLTTLRLLGYPLNLRQIPKKYEILTLLSPVGYLLKLDTDIYTCMTPFIDSYVYDTNASINHMCLLISVNVIRIKDKS